MRNPFKVLGLTPDIIRRLGNDETVMKAVSRVYKALALVFHPDAGGSESSFKEISLAAEALSDPVAFHHYKEEYLKPRKDQLEELSVETAELAAEFERVTAQLQDYVSLAIRTGGIPVEGVLLMFDSLTAAISNEAPENISKWGTQRGNFELVKVGGKWSRSPLVFEREKEVPELATGYYRLDSNWVRVVGKGDHKSAFRYTPKGKPKALDCALVGTVRIDGEGSDNRSIKNALAITGTREDFDRARNGYGWDFFQYLLPTLSTEVKPGRHLVGAKLVEGRIRFFLLGKIFAIEASDV